MKRTFFPLFLLFPFLLSCDNGTKLLNLFEEKQEDLSLEKDFNRIEVEGDYSILIPKYMKENKELHTEASLAYQHALKEVATLVLDENKAELEGSLELLDGYVDSASFIENYANVQLNMIASSLGFAEKGDVVLKQIGELPAAQAWLEGQIEGMPIAYFINCVEARDKVYLVMSYTSQEKKPKFEATFIKIADSFQLISPVID